jgi:ATP-dependent Clp protease ATP-binding subunit ClpC
MSHKIYLNPKETLVYRAASAKRYFQGFFAKAVKFIVYFLTIAGIVYLALVVSKMTEMNSLYIGLVLIVFSSAVAEIAINYYYHGFLLCFNKKNDLKKIVATVEEGNRVNLWQYFSIDLSTELSLTGLNFQNKYDSRHLILAIIDSAEVIELLVRLALPHQEISQLIKEEKSGNGNLSEIWLKSLQVASAENHHAIEVSDLFLALALADPVLKKIIFDQKIEPSDIANVIYWQTKEKKLIADFRKVFDPDNLSLTGGIGRDWAYGYTINLEQFSRDLSELVRAGGLNALELEAKDREIGQMEEALNRAQNHNIVIVGDPGIGKKTTVYGLAKKIYHGKTSSAISNRRMLELDIEAILAGAENQNQIVERLRVVFNEAASAGNIILFIDNIASIFSDDQQVGRVNALEAVLPYLEQPNIYIIGTVTTEDYRKYFANNRTLVSSFVKVEMHEPNFDETIRIVEDALPQIEGRCKVIVSYEAIKEATKLTDKLIQNLPQPQKTINLIDQVASKKASTGEKMVFPKDIDLVIENQTNVPVGDLENNEKEILLNLEDFLHKRVIGQNEAIIAIANALRRARAGVTDSKKPIGSFLFLGPTGVGKTETTKALAEAYFRSEEAMIRFDMSEYQQKTDLYRLIGDPNDQSRQGLLTAAIREKPFSLILFDEIEKADKNILNLFLQLLDEGFITDAFGQKAVFSNSIVIMTSNAGSEFIRQAAEKELEYQKTQKMLLNYIQENDYFRPEFLNRFTQVVVFKPLSLPEIGEVAALLIKKLAKNLEQEKGVFIEVEKPAVEKLARAGFDPKMGARPMQRSIQEHLENILAKKILSGEIDRGDRIKVSAVDLDIK